MSLIGFIGIQSVVLLSLQWVGNYVHSVSNVVYYYAISLGSCSWLFYSINAIYAILSVSASSLYYSSGYSMHRGDDSISKSLEGCS
jgi:hypothetical protein